MLVLKHERMLRGIAESAHALKIHNKEDGLEEPTAVDEEFFQN